MRDTPLSIQVADSEQRALEQVLSLLDAENSHLSVVAASGEACRLSPSLEGGLRAILHVLRAQRAIEVLPVEEELTPNEAAERLNVSRTFISKLIERGELSCRMVGTHKRIPLGDVLACKERMAAKRQTGLAAIAELSQAQRGEIDAPYPGRRQV
ncbi:MAG TPA: excisionase family DNA-binding protein [Oscillatoriaceae cyanobacterium]